MSDGIEIPSDVDLFCIKEEDDILYLIYENEKNDKILFWSRLEELKYIGEVEKEFDESLGDIIDGNYFNLI